MPKNLTSIDDQAFIDCKSLEKIEIPDTVYNMGTNIFEGCVLLSEIKLPKYRVDIPVETFKNCTSLEKIYYGGTEAQWNNKLSRANDSSDRFHSIKFESGWKDGAADFEVVFENNLTKPGKYTFIADVYMPDGVNTTAWIRFGTIKPDGKTGDPNFWDSKNYITGNGTWCTYPKEFEVTEGGDIIANYSLRKSKAEVYYVDNVRIYYKG